MKTTSPFHIMSKPSGAVCNLDCKYCYFLSKEVMYPQSNFRMSDDVLEAYIREYIASQPANLITFAWQGGEPTLMGIDFFKKAIDFQKKYAHRGIKIENTLQTNGTLLDEDWTKFFKEHNFLLGISIDGPPELHDTYRVNKGGEGTFSQALRGLKLLQKYGVEYNILCTVHAANQDHPLDVYRFFRDELGAAFIQFIPIVERTTPEILPIANLGWRENNGAERPLYTQNGTKYTRRSVNAKKYGAFLTTIFDEWVRNDVGKIFVQHFDVALAAWFGQPGALCIFAPTCGQALALEHNGDLFSCDHYVEPDYKLGNILETPLLQLATAPKQRRFGEEKLSSLPRYCRECEVRFACHGGCPKNRFIRTPDGEEGLNYLCKGYKTFFNHIDEPMKIMVSLLKAQRPPAEIIQILAAQKDK
jgi:uncharacterized protein